MPVRTIRILVLSLLVSSPLPAFAQTSTTLPSTDLARVIYEAFLRETRINLGAGGAAKTGQAANLALIMTAAISGQTSSFPLGSSAGGFTFSFDPSVGAFTRSSNSFGPLVSDRALTVGRKKANFGLSVQRATYDEFEGLDVTNGEVAFYTPFPPSLTGKDALFLDLSSTTVSVFANYGVSDRFDVGVVVPFVSTKLDADLQFTFRSSTGAQAGTFEDHLIGGGSKSGVGDIVLRTKYRLADLRGGGVAAGVDFRVGTGDEKNLLGIPGNQVKIYGIVSGQAGKVSPHVNIGFTASSASDAAKDPTYPLIEPSDEINLAFGADIAATSRVTIAGDIISRTLRDYPKLELAGPSPFQELSLSGFGNVNLPLASIGAKVNAARNLLIGVNVLFPLNDTGLRDKFTPSFGFDYSF
jgi:hypothetical protein